jgi:GNAT superfamily N-acetyltransferase
MDIRLLTANDIEACIDVFYEADETLTAGMNLAINPRNPEAMRRIFEHVSGTDPRRAWVADDGGEIVGFGMAAEREQLTFLAFLFVRPRAQAAGVGAQLYARCMPDSGYRGTCIWSVQPISGALYARNGLVPRVPIYTIMGRPREALPVLPAGLFLTDIDPDEIEALDREVVGFARPADHDAWQRWERIPFALRAEEGKIEGYGYAQAAGRLGPILVRDAGHLLPLIGVLMSRVEAVEGWQVHVPGVAAQPFAALLRAGMRFDGPPIIYCATQPGIDHSRYVPATFALP